MAAQGQRLFNRIAYGLITSRVTNQQVRLSEGLRIKFQIEKISGGYTNKMSVDLYNLSAQTIALLQDIGVNFKLFAGYDGTPRLLANGDVYSCKNSRQGPDIITTIEAFDGGFAVDNFQVNASVGIGGTNQQLLNKIIAGAQAADPLLTLGNIQQIPLKVYPKGQVISKSFQDAMNQIIVFGLPNVNNQQVQWTWGITDGVLNVTPMNAKNAGNAFKLTPSTGLIGIPSKNNLVPGALNPADSHPVFTFQSLLNPLLNPDDLVDVESEFVPAGLYQIYKTDHNGDTFEGQYETDLECYEPNED